MDISLKNYKTALPKELQKLAEKNEVRECDETEKGHYVAYVDEGKDTFDVSLIFGTDKKISSHACDCKNTGDFCRHKAALLMHIAKGAKITPGIKAKKKSKAEALLDEAEPDELKQWVKDLLQKNKDIELSFVYFFSARQQQYSPDEVINLTSEAVKTVVKNKKNIDPTQLKKVVDLLTDIHAPIVKSYQANVTNENSFLCFYALLESCIVFQSNITSSSNRVAKYAEGLLQQSVEAVNNLYNEETWKTAVSYFIEKIFDKYKIRMHYAFHLKNILSISSADRRNTLINLLAIQYKKRFSENITNENQYTKALFEIMEEYELIGRYYKIFAPLTFDNDYNVKLIKTFIDNGELETAKQYCDKQIKSNYRDEYNIAYMKLLKEIYILENDETNLATVLSQLLPHTFDFDDFLYTYNRMKSVEEKKKWRTKILTRARTDSNRHDTAAAEFSFKLMDYEKKYPKMIEYINSHTPYHLILQFLEPMIKESKTALLKAIIDKSEGYFVSDKNEKDKQIFPQLLSGLLKHFNADYLDRVISQETKRKYYYTPNGFIRYVQANLI